MKSNLAYLIVLISTLFLSACDSTNSRGEACIGAFDQPKPEVTYRVSVKNVVLGIIFWELVFPPVIVIVNETRCPLEK